MAQSIAGFNLLITKEWVEKFEIFYRKQELRMEK